MAGLMTPLQQTTMT